MSSGPSTSLARTLGAPENPTDIDVLAPTTLFHFASPRSNSALRALPRTVCNYGVNQNIKVSNAQWQIPICLNFIVGTIILVGSLFIKESPRWLIKVGQHERARANLAWLRHLPHDHPELRAELDDIDAQVREEKHLTDGLGLWGAVKELFGTANNRYKLALCLTIQILGQLSGGGSFTVFAPKFLALVGKTGNTGLLTTGLFGIVKLIASVTCAIFVIDLLGRRRCVSIGIILQAIAALYLAIYLKVAYVGQDTSDPSPSQKRAATGGVVMIFVSGIGWAFGVNSVQYLINSEIFAVQVRALGSGITMCVHFAMQYASSRSTNPMIADMDTWGAFLFYTAICVLLLLFILFFLPETAGYSLEQIDALFDLPWYKIGMASRRPFDGKTHSGRVSIEDGPQQRGGPAEEGAEKTQFGTYGGDQPTVASPGEDEKKTGMTEAEQKRAAGMTTTNTVDY